jgi:hypothetical protein
MIIGLLNLCKRRFVWSLIIIAASFLFIIKKMEKVFSDETVVSIIICTAGGA